MLCYYFPSRRFAAQPRAQRARFITSAVDSQGQGLSGIFVRCSYLSSVQQTPQIPAESDEKFLLIYGTPTPPPHSHPALLELEHKGAAGVRYCFAIKLNRPKVFRDNVFLYQSIYERGKIFWFGPFPLLFSRLHTLKTVYFYFLPLFLNDPSAMVAFD